MGRLPGCALRAAGPCCHLVARWLVRVQETLCPPHASISAVGMLHICLCRGDAPHPSMSWGCRIHPCCRDAPHPVVPWGCPHLSVPWRWPLSLSAMMTPRVHLCCGFSPHPSLPWGRHASIRTVGLLHVHLRRQIAQRPSMPWRCLTQSACCHQTQGDKPFLCQLPAPVHVSRV